MCELNMYESSEIYAIGYDTPNGDFDKIAIFKKKDVSKTQAEDIFNYLKNNERFME